MSHVQFGILSPDEIRRWSVCEVKERVMMEPNTGLPREGGLYDQRMGCPPRQSAWKCATCKGSSSTKQGAFDCPGHFGHMELISPVFHPGFLPHLIRILRSICYNCGKLLADEKDERYLRAMRTSNPQQRLNLMYAAARVRKTCGGAGGGELLDGGEEEHRRGCGEKQPKVSAWS